MKISSRLISRDVMDDDRFDTYLVRVEAPGLEVNFEAIDQGSFGWSAEAPITRDDYVYGWTLAELAESYLQDLEIGS